LEDINNQPVEDAQITLFDTSGNDIWSGTSNSTGQANFDITYTQSNYTNSLALKAAKGNSVALTTVSFLSNTPLRIGLWRHDVAIGDVSPCKNVVGQGYAVPANVTVANKGDYTETSVSLSLYANATEIGTQTVYYLMNGTNTTTVIDGTITSSLAYGTYILNVSASLAAGGTGATNGNCTCGSITVTIPGDINGDFKVDLTDLVLLAQAYGSKPGDSNWNPNADIDGGGVVGLSDLVILTQHYGQQITAIMSPPYAFPILITNSQPEPESCKR
jgi:hypothetical protein